MATVTEPMFWCPEAQVDVTFSDTDGAVSALAWRVDSGTMDVVVYQTGLPDISVTKTAPDSGTQAVPSGYSLTLGPKGDWKWISSTSSYEVSWHA